MRRVIVYIAMSIDGYVADNDGGVGWIRGDGSDETNMGSYPAFIDTVDTVILGYSTYNQIVNELSPDVWVYAGKQSYVLTHRKIENEEEIIFTDEDLGTLIAGLKKQDGESIWICGGARIVNQLKELNLIDEYILSVIPVILGDGIRLFDKSNSDVKLKLKSTVSYNGIVDLNYECDNS